MALLNIVFYRYHQLTYKTKSRESEITAQFLYYFPLLNITHGFLPFTQVQAPPVIPATPLPTAVTEVASGDSADVVQAVAEQTFAELGLGSYTPVGLIQNLLETMHVNLGLPWWGAIAACKDNRIWSGEMGT